MVVFAKQSLLRVQKDKQTTKWAHRLVWCVRSTTYLNYIIMARYSKISYHNIACWTTRGVTGGTVNQQRNSGDLKQETIFKNLRLFLKYARRHFLHENNPTKTALTNIFVIKSCRAAKLLILCFCEFWNLSCIAHITTYKQHTFSKTLERSYWNIQ